MTTQAQARERAAQIWCEPQHAHKEMDADLAESIACALTGAEAAVWEKAATLIETRAQGWYTMKTEDEEARVLYQRLGNVLHHVSTVCAEQARTVREGKETP